MRESRTRACQLPFLNTLFLIFSPPCLLHSCGGVFFTNCVDLYFKAIYYQVMQYEIQFKITKTIPSWEVDTDDKQLAQEYAYARARDWFESLDPSNVDIEVVEVD